MAINLHRFLTSLSEEVWHTESKTEKALHPELSENLVRALTETGDSFHKAE